MVYSLVVILLVLALDRLLPDRRGFDPFSWFRDWAESVEQRFNGGLPRQGLAALGLTVGTVFLVVLLLQALLAQMNWLLRFGFDLAVMYFFVQVSSKLAAAQQIVRTVAGGDDEAADEVPGGLSTIVDEPVTDANAVWTGSIRLLAGADSWFFAPVFWFVILGPAGAVLYYTAGVTARTWDWRNARFQEFGRAAHNLHQILAWLPVRILAISYALLGDFENVLQTWSRQRDVWTGSSSQLLITVGLAALGQDPEDRFPDISLLERAVALGYRVVIFWGIGGAILAIAGLVR